MKEISKERADEIEAAWNAASDTQRLSLPHMSWFATDTVTYYEHQPSPLHLKVAARVAELEAILHEIEGIYEATPQTPAKLCAALYAVSKLARRALSDDDHRSSPAGSDQLL